MSTRSCIARKEGQGWKGVYHHSDGYPSGLGCYIFRSIHHDFNGDVRAFLEWVLSHDGGWSHIFPGGIIRADRKGGEVFDKHHPQAQCYCHGYFARRDGIRPGQGTGVITGCQCGEKPYITGAHDPSGGPSCDPLSIEWVYVLDPEARVMTVLEAYGEDIPGTMASVCVRPKRAYRHRQNAVVDLDGPEPDWWQMEENFGPEHLKRRTTWVDDILTPVGKPL